MSMGVWWEGGWFLYFEFFFFMSLILILLDVIGFELNLNAFMSILLHMRPMRS